VFTFAQYAFRREASIVGLSPMLELGGGYHRGTLNLLAPAHCEWNGKTSPIGFSPISSLTVGRFTNQHAARKTCEGLLFLQKHQLRGLSVIERNSCKRRSTRVHRGAPPTPAPPT